jgi:hypothetical protein
VRSDFYSHENARLLIRQEYRRLEETGCGRMNNTIPFFDMLEDGRWVSTRYIDSLIGRIAAIKHKL